jgi:hypothetical protein
VTLVEFLTAMLDRDEAAARAATCETGRWHWDHAFGDLCNDAECPYGELVDQPASSSDHSGTVLMRVHGLDVVHEPWRGAEHIARHDPDRVLREVEAKRRIIESRPGIGAPGHMLDVVHDEVQRQREHVLRLLALPYADHEDYREEWKP